MDDELEALRDHNTDLEKTAGPVGSDDHCEVVSPEHTHRVSIGMKNVVVNDLVSPGARQDHRIHDIKLP